MTRAGQQDLRGDLSGEVDDLATEGIRHDLEDLDSGSTAEVVAALLAAEARVPDVLAAARDRLTELADLAARVLAEGGRIVYVGAGTPGRLAALDAAECPPTFGVSPDRVVALIAGGDRAAEAAVEGVEDDAGAGADAVRQAGVGPGDLVVGITASGRTPYVLAALTAARDAGAEVAAIVNNVASRAAEVAALVVELETGPEVVSGSTRLTAGTSQKVALNVLSTAAMIRNGKTYRARMVDVVAANAKLRRRAVRTVTDLTGVDDPAATAALEDAGWHAKTALVMLLGDVDADTARSRLDAAGGRVREALEG